MIPHSRMPTENKPLFYYPELDGLRFVAFLLVFLHNANPILRGTFLETFSEYSWFGVDLFFCLSGFLITKLLVTEHEQTGQINIRKFYMRRALRILPLYFFYIVLGAIIIAPVEGRNENLARHVASLSTFTFNFAYFALLPSPILIFVHLWSISYEAQFYAGIPWFVRNLAAAAHSTKVFWLALVFLMGLVTRAVFIGLNFHPAAMYFLPIAHFDSILGGVALGLGILDRVFKRFERGNLWAISLASISMIWFLPNNDVTASGLMLTYLLVGVAATLFIFLIANEESPPARRLFGNPVFVFLGKISYGLYVYHFGVFALTGLFLAQLPKIPRETFTGFYGLLIATSFTLTILFSTLSYYLIEMPFLKLKQRLSPAGSYPPLIK